SYEEFLAYYDVEILADPRKFVRNTQVKVYRDYATVRDHLASLIVMAQGLVPVETQKGKGVFIQRHPLGNETYWRWLDSVDKKAHESTLPIRDENTQLFIYKGNNGIKQTNYIRFHSLVNTNNSFPNHYW